MSIKPTDLDLMMLADGELEPERAREVSLAVERDPALKAKLQAIGQVGDGVRTFLEIETDHAEAELPEFADMWATIERRIATGGAAAADEQASAFAAPPRRPPAGSTSDANLWARVTGWFEGHRGHVMTGLVSAGAAVLLVLVLRPPDRIVGTTTVVAPPIQPTQVASGVPCGPAAGQAIAPAQPPEVESFEVYDGSGLVFTLPGEGEGDSAATVIWISKDEDTVEGPI